LTKLRARVVKSGGFVGVYQDFSGGLKDEQFDNLAYSLIHNIANVPDHARRWARRNARALASVDRAVGASFETRVMIDLSNNDKHGYPPRNRGRSGRSPRLVNARRVLRMTTGKERGSSVAMTFAPDGTPQVSGSGSAKAILTGEIIDDQDVDIGDLYDMASRAVEDWERILQELGALPGSNSPADA